MTIKTLAALRYLAVNSLADATCRANATRNQLNMTQEMLDQAEADGADEGTLAKYREDVRGLRDDHLTAMERQREAQAVLDDLDAHDWH